MTVDDAVVALEVCPGLRGDTQGQHLPSVPRGPAETGAEIKINQAGTSLAETVIDPAETGQVETETGQVGTETGQVETGTSPVAVRRETPPHITGRYRTGIGRAKTERGQTTPMLMIRISQKAQAEKEQVHRGRCQRTLTIWGIVTVLIITDHVKEAKVLAGPEVEVLIPENSKVEVHLDVVNTFYYCNEEFCGYYFVK